MSHIKCKAGDKVVLYRKDDCYPHLKVGEDIFTIVEGDLPFPIGRIAGDKSKYPQNYCFKPTSIRHLRKTDKGAKVIVITYGHKDEHWHDFPKGDLVTLTGETYLWKGKIGYRAKSITGATQFLLLSQFKLAKEQ